MGPDPKVAGGYYVWVANGSMAANSQTLPEWSMMFVESSEAAFEIKAGPVGLEALVMRFAVDDD